MKKILFFILLVFGSVIRAQDTSDITQLDFTELLKGAGPTFTYLSERYGESKAQSRGLTTGYDNTRYESLLLTNLSCVYKEILKKIDLSLSVYNLFDQNTYSFNLIMAVMLPFRQTIGKLWWD